MTPTLRPVRGCLEHGSVSDPYGNLPCSCLHESQQALEELTEQAQGMGLYDLEVGDESI